MSQHYLTGEFPGIGGVIKQRPEDFFVQEIPAYEPTGEGEHVFVEIQKVGLTTFNAVEKIADALHVATRDIGYAGLKDARAVTRQVLSILGTTEQSVMDLRIPNITIQWAARHGNKMRLGHLRANRFAIKIREVEPTDVVKLQPMLDVLVKRGMPNYFGEQRFGRRGDNHMLGASIVRNDYKTMLKLLLGSPNPGIDNRESLRARTHYEAGELDKSMHAWPRRCGMERRILARLMKTKRHAAAAHAIDHKLTRLWVSAIQSHLFNQILDRRLESIDKLMDGDLAYKHGHGAGFTVESAAAEQPRADAFEISATGPLVGYRVSLPTGKPLEIEHAVFHAAGLSPGMFRHEGRVKIKGARRPLRVQPTGIELAAGVDEHGSHITVAFTLPAGSFATVLLGELMKNESQSEPAEAAVVEGDDEEVSGDDAAMESKESEHSDGGEIESAEDDVA